MKNLWFSFSLYLLSSLLLPTTISAQVASGRLPVVNRAANAMARGAANPQELAQTVLQAIQQNNPAGLDAFLLEDAEYVQLKQKGSEDMKAFLESTPVADLKNTFRNGYDELIKKGISQTINWMELEVSEARLGKGTAKNTQLQPVTVILTDKQNQSLTLLLEIIKINKRYFLFRKIELLPRQ